MLKYLIQVVQNLLSTAILSALLAALVWKTAGAEGAGKRRFLLGGTAGCAAALVVAVLRRTTRFINREYLNTAVLSLAIPGALFFIVLLWAFRTRKELREKLLSWVTPVLAGALLFYALPTIFLYPPEFLLPGQSVFTTDFLYKLIGFLAGLLAVVLSGLGLFETAKVLPLSRIKIVLSAALFVNLVHQLSVIVQFLLARRIIAVPRPVFRMMVWIINHNSVFLYLIMGLSFCIPLLLCLANLGPLPVARNPAERRKLRALRRAEWRWGTVVAGAYIVAVLSLTVIKSYNERGVTLTPAEPMTIIGKEIIIPIEKIADGHLHRYNYLAADDIEMRFIVIKKNEVAYGVGLDACDICGPTGYYERKNQVICRLCDVVMNISTIGFKGGCNPVPLAYTLRSGNMVIDTENLEKERNRFK
ncbi:MAG: DUF2318 domain-containing protein [Treponema sp.]|jgi:uncharacterized membrane protein|nr:DUF2318 domain-containing protein [Treponema sp.]